MKKLFLIPLFLLLACSKKNDPAPTSTSSTTDITITAGSSSGSIGTAVEVSLSGVVSADYTSYGNTRTFKSVPYGTVYYSVIYNGTVHGQVEVNANQKSFSLLGN